MKIKHNKLKLFILSTTLIFTLAALLVSCGESSKDNTKVSFITSGFSTDSSFNTLYVYGISEHGDSFGRILGIRDINFIAPGKDIDISLPNKKWKFFAVGWDGTSPFTGNIFCGVANQNDSNKLSEFIPLSGGQLPVQIAVDATTCKDRSVFNYYVGETIKPIRVVTCSNQFMDGIMNSTGTSITYPDKDQDCASTGDTGSAKSFLMKLPSFGPRPKDDIGRNMDEFIFQDPVNAEYFCLNLNSTESVTNLIIPTGKVMEVTFEGFDQVDCQGTKTSINRLTRGLNDSFGHLYQPMNKVLHVDKNDYSSSIYTSLFLIDSGQHN